MGDIAALKLCRIELPLLTTRVNSKMGLHFAGIDQYDSDIVLSFGSDAPVVKMIIFLSLNLLRSFFIIFTPLILTSPFNSLQSG